MGRALVLYGTSACHLCELAEELLDEILSSNADVCYEKADISDSDDLFTRYGIRIPVLKRWDGEELGWPFDKNDLGDFLKIK